MEYMISSATRTERIAPQQLTLLSEPTTPKELAASNRPVQFQLSKATRERGLAHVAQIRQQLAESHARLEASKMHPLPHRTPQAA